MTRFIRREPDIQQFGRLLAGAWQVTLTGAGGCGTTRRALHEAMTPQQALALAGL